MREEDKKVLSLGGRSRTIKLLKGSLVALLNLSYLRQKKIKKKRLTTQIMLQIEARSTHDMISWLTAVIGSQQCQSPRTGNS